MRLKKIKTKTNIALKKGDVISEGTDKQDAEKIAFVSVSLCQKTMCNVLSKCNFISNNSLIILGWLVQRLLSKEMVGDLTEDRVLH